MAVANYNAIVALPGAYAIRFNASDAHQDYYEFNPAEGMLLNNFPAGMFSDTSIYWIERVRGTFDGQTGVNDGGQSYVKVAIGFHKDSSVVAQNTFLGAMSNDASWILINETTEEWLMWPANGSAGGELGSGFVTYQVIPSYIADTSGLGQRDVPAIAEDFDGIEPLIAGQVFQNGLINSELVVGLIPNNTFRPSFGPVTRPIAATFPGVSGTLSAAVARATPVTHPAAANFGGAAGSISAALQRQIATVNLAVAVTFSGTAGQHQRCRCQGAAGQPRRRRHLLRRGRQHQRCRCQGAAGQPRRRRHLPRHGRQHIRRRDARARARLSGATSGGSASRRWRRR